MPVCYCFRSLFKHFFKKDFINSFPDGGEGREKERERNIGVWLPPTYLPPGARLVTQACAPTGNQTGGPLVHRLALNPLRHTSQASAPPPFFFFKEREGKEGRKSGLRYVDWLPLTLPQLGSWPTIQACALTWN